MIKGREEISESEIRTGMDFDAQLKKYPEAGWGWRGWLGGAVVVLGITAGVIGLGPGTSPPSLPEIKTPVSGLAPFYMQDTNYLVNTEKGDTLEFPGGSRIFIPPLAFADASGNPVKGKVRLHYAEYHDPKDFFLSGIPMTYDSAGNQFHFESGGMLEITAFDGEQALQTIPGRPIRIALASRQPGDHFNTYFLDQRDGKWEFIARDTVGMPEPWKKQLDELVENSGPSGALKFLAGDLSIEEKKLDALKKQVPVSPYEPGPGDLLFVVDVDSAQFPELFAFRSVRFAIAPEEKHFARIKAAKTWRGVKLETSAETGKYMITFTDWKEKYVVHARPVLSGQDRVAAETQYLNELAGYNLKLKERQTKVRERLLQLKTLNDRYDAEVDFDNNGRKLLMQWQQQINATTEMVFRVFYAEKFGIYNCDCPKMLPKGMDVVAKMQGPDGKGLMLDKVYLVEKGTNALFTYYASQLAHFRYDPKRRNQLWALTADGRLATISTDEFKKVKPVEDTCVYTFTIHPGKIKTGEDARSLLNL